MASRGRLFRLQKPQAAATSEPKSAANAAKFTAALSRNLIADRRSRNSHNQLELHNILWRIISAITCARARSQDTRSVRGSASKKCGSSIRARIFGKPDAILPTDQRNTHRG